MEIIAKLIILLAAKIIVVINFNWKAQDLKDIVMVILIKLIHFQYLQN